MSERSADFEARLSLIEERNARAEYDKAWEASKARRLVIALSTYLVVVAYNAAVGVDAPWLTAVVPTVGFLLSTLTFRFMKKRWIQDKSRTTPSP